MTDRAGSKMKQEAREMRGSTSLDPISQNIKEARRRGGRRREVRDHGLSCPTHGESHARKTRDRDVNE